MKILNCKHCDKTFKSIPVTISECGIDIRRTHDENSFECKICFNSQENNVKTQNVLFELNKQKIDSKIKELINYDKYMKNPYDYVYEYFDDLKGKIHKRKADIIEQVTEHFNKMIEELDEALARIKNSIDSNEKIVPIQRFNQILKGVTIFKDEILKESERIEKLQVSLKEKNELIEKNLDEIENYQKNLNYRLNFLTENKTYHLTEKSWIGKNELFGELKIKRIQLFDKLISEKIETGTSLVLNLKKNELFSISVNKIEIWNIQTGQCLRTFESQNADHLRVIFGESRPLRELA